MTNADDLFPQTIYHPYGWGLAVCKKSSAEPIGRIRGFKRKWRKDKLSGTSSTVYRDSAVAPRMGID
jgi:hypothetical protein